jgi:hypothetical protein
LLGFALSDHQATFSAGSQVDAKSLDSRSRALLTSAEVVLSVGAVAAVGGLVWGLVRTRRGRR